MTPSVETIAATRFGYGLSPAEAPPAGPEALLEGVRRGAEAARAAPTTMATRMAALADYDRLRRMEGADRRPADLRAARRTLARLQAADATTRVETAALSPHGFYERLVWFWADHFTVAGRNRRGIAIAPAFEADAIRPNVAGSFAALLRAAVGHPAMLVYLGQVRSTGPASPVGLRRGVGLNENLAREVLELHTLGVGADYAQADVVEFAELLTGLAMDRKAGATVFLPDRAEPGAETVLGRRYGGRRARAEDIGRALDDLATHPSTARHVAAKLAGHFVADAPDEGLVAHLEAAYLRSDGDLPTVYAALLEHPASWDGLGAKVRQPFDYVVASLRATGPRRPDDLARFRKGADGPDPVAALARLNQPLWGAPGPDGWPEAAEAWISPPGLTARIDWASQLGEALAASGTDPRTFLEGALGDRARDATRFAASSAAERWEGIALVLASPEFNRR